MVGHGPFHLVLLFEMVGLAGQLKCLLVIEPLITKS
jgi:hypothetical protein